MFLIHSLHGMDTSDQSLLASGIPHIVTYILKMVCGTIPCTSVENISKKQELP